MVDGSLSASKAYATQTMAPMELRVLSQPKDRPDISIDHYDNYVYRTDRQSESYIYHAELGIDPQHLDFHKRPIEWLYTGRAISRGQNTRTEARAAQGHSTCTASKAAGRIYGASKIATLVVVKMPDYSEASIAGILGTIIDDITARSRQGKSVVSISWGSKAPMTPPFPRGWQDLHDYRKQLRRVLKVDTVVAAGNSANYKNSRGEKRTIADTAPAIFRDWEMGRGGASFFVVENCFNNGSRHPTSQIHDTFLFRYDIIFSICAPGVDVVCPTGKWTGTSFCEYLLSERSLSTKILQQPAAPLVAGVIADYIGVASSETMPWDDRSFLFNDIWWRRGNGENVVWNGIYAENNPTRRLSTFRSGLSNITAALANDAATE